MGRTRKLMSKACYRKIDRYKYQLVDDYQLQIPLNGGEKGKHIISSYVQLDVYGSLWIKKGYCWDGPSGLTIDTLNFMRGSLVHDALYQLFRLGLLNIESREVADEILRRICIEDGMSKLRAWYVYKAVRWFGAAAARPGSQKPLVITCIEAPKKIEQTT